MDFLSLRIDDTKQDCINATYKQSSINDRIYIVHVSGIL